MEKGRGKGTDTLQTDNVFTRKEYIEREAALILLDGIYDCNDMVFEKNDSCVGLDCGSCRWRDTKNYIWNRLSRIPAAGVVPVRYGRWVKVDDGIYYHTECSLCHERPLRNRWVNDNELSSYCPNCGARMDGDGE